ncbi:3-deoxy-D-manno-octulosonic acid kinase [Achromobacter mucicolens]|uniref:3-deoxy-D-manno-octulosonic acid kinase n=2 Tax=Achromobacter mucicolens TaxID=1389922 RepID=A0ABM8LFT3_9BURK|nr:3-deoxy-D-manno-octulosonic acid kinase [Achromobacter mucicolens]MCP2516255.1 3-deoxy-D-manno-octulosonic acid kinase [Achromobacter mucicolens]CAB3881090.1 3-deoxy-D-manno-octulosonic acid kinase [Achromobacter mucicolens]
MKGDDQSGARRTAWEGPLAGAMLSDARRVADAGPEVFNPAHYGDRARPVDAGGRQAAWFVEGQGWQGVLRRYRRGGMIARISRDAYLWNGESRTRSFREYRLLAALRAQGLPVPAPLAAAYWRQGPIYRAAIVVERIPGVRPLAQALTEPLWQPVADAIVRMHRAGVWHADLNAFNILIGNDGRVWLIDFDRGTQGALSERQRQANLDRLRRSLRKVAGEAGDRFWMRLRDSYWTAWGIGIQP